MSQSEQRPEPVPATVNRERLSDPNALSTMKRKDVRRPTISIPQGFTGLSANLLIHNDTELLVDLPKRRFADPMTRFFINRNNAIAIELYKHKRMPYYLVTKSDACPANWVFLANQEHRRELSQLVNEVPVQLCSTCLLVASSGQKMHEHGCPRQEALQCRGYAYRPEMNGHHVVITELPDVQGKMKEVLEQLVADQQRVITAPSEEALAQELEFREEWQRVWQEAIEERRTNAKMQYRSKRDTVSLLVKRRRAQREARAKERLERRCDLVELPSPEPVQASESTEEEEVAENPIAPLSSTVLSFTSLIINQSTLGPSSDVLKMNQYLETTLDEYLSDPDVSTTVLPYVLLDSITDDLWDGDPPVSNTFRFRLDAKYMKLLVFDEEYKFPLSIQLLNRGGATGWMVRVWLDPRPEDLEEFKQPMSFESKDLAFPALCQTLVVFRALVFTLMTCIGEGRQLPPKAARGAFVVRCFDWVPCTEEQAIKVVGKGLCQHVSKCR